jgi:predicted phosphodiesterase
MDNLDYIFVKDMHLSFSFRNRIRRHGWERHIDDKLNQIIRYMKDNNITYLFTAGDIFDRSKRKDWSFSQFQANKARLQKFKDAGIVLYSNLGNHDTMDGYEYVQGTVFGEMVELGLINYIGSSMPPVVFNTSRATIGLFGIDHHQSDEKVIDELHRIQAFPNIDIKIALMHSNITDNNTRITDFTYNQISEFDIDVINCGHWHLEPDNGPIQNINGTHFLNPWNMTRVMRDYNVKLDEHKPSFIHGTISMIGEEPYFKFEEIPLVVEPFSVAFQTEIINLLQDLGKDGFQFFKEIDLTQDDELNDDETILVKIAKANDISKEAVQIAKDMLI